MMDKCCECRHARVTTTGPMSTGNMGMTGPVYWCSKYLIPPVIDRVCGRVGQARLRSCDKIRTQDKCGLFENGKPEMIEWSWSLLEN